MAAEKPTTESTSTAVPIASPPAKGKSLLVNYFSLLSGTVSAKALSLVTVLMLTRYLGVEDFGRYSLVFSFWALLNTLVDFGGGQILVRDIARHPDNPRPSIESFIYLRLLGCLIFLPFGYLLAEPLGINGGLALISFLGIFVGFEVIYDIYFSATMQLDQNAKARFFSSILNVILMSAAILLKLPLIAIILIALLNPLVKLIWDYRYARFQPRIGSPDWSHVKRMAIDGWPLWLAGVQYIILARVDTFLLQVLSQNGEYNLGIYAAAFRFTEVMALLINALCPAILPLLVRHMHTPERIGFLASTGTRLIMSVVIAISLFIFWVSPWIVRIYGPEYGEAARCMQILIWSQALVAVNSICYQLMVVYNMQGRRWAILSGTLVTLLNVGLNFWLIPLLQAEGASWATLATELAMALLTLGLLRAYTPVRLHRDVLVMGILTALSCVPGLLLGNMAVSIFVFILLVFAFRVLTVKDIRVLAHERLHEDPSNPT